MVGLEPGLNKFNKPFKIGLILISFLPLSFLMDIQRLIHIWQPISLFLILLLISNLVSARLDSGVYFSVGFIIELTIMQVYGVYVVCFTTFVTVLLANLIAMVSGGRKSTNSILLNAYINTITVAVAGISYKLVPNQVLGFITATVTYFVLFVTLVSFLQFFKEKRERGFAEYWIELGKEISLNYFILAPLAYLIPYAFNIVDSHNRLFPVLLFFVPVMLVNYALRLYANIRQSYLNTVKTLVAAIEAKDRFVKGHAERVAFYALAIAREMNYSERELTRLHYVALLHDAGKIAIQDRILNKPESLTGEEYDRVKEHSTIGAGIIEKIKFLASDADIVRYHHEKFDGTGYPEGLQGFEIPEGARILAAVDAFDAMTTERPYRKAKTKREAIEEMGDLAGKQFDPQVVEVFRKVLKRQGEI